MFCPSCGIEDQKESQFCRTCGAELHTVRTALDRTDVITSPAVTARDQIGQVIAEKIRELRIADDLKDVAENILPQILPQIERFLESPEERRLRRFREGTITAAVGLGVMLCSLLVASITHSEMASILTFTAAGCGIITLLVGLGIIISARWLTVVPKTVEPSVRISKPSVNSQKTKGLLNESPPSEPPSTLASVPEVTTRQLK